MNFQELSQFINHKKVYSYRKFYKHEVLHEKDFEKIKQFFEPTTTIFHLWRPTWRSGERLRHWHAVKYDEFVELHCDFGNINKTYWFGFFHFFVDVLGYSIWCLLRLMWRSCVRFGVFRVCSWCFFRSSWCSSRSFWCISLLLLLR
jgi:hypothetical protein